MHLNFRLCTVICLLIELVGITIFLQGFFPIKHSVPGYATKDQAVTEPFVTVPLEEESFDTSLYKRLVFILIDALRYDFVLPSSGSDLPHLPFVETLISKNNTHAFLAKAHPPTVTLPRLKALTTGGIPGFIDVILNFDSSALHDDNIISQLHRNGRRIAFYGDDTWMRLFPNHFIRSDGTTSFFVTDYTEVDDNVTRHIEEELGRKDWDILILHYLGLDHIGHLAGPRSPLIKPKLLEMDDIIRNIYSKVIDHDESGSGPTLLVLCGDHGMSDQGSHGGSTSSETSTPLVFMSSLLQGGTGSVYDGRVVQQIDVAPTLALALGLPVPQNSLGTLITDVLAGTPMRRRLSNSYLNAQQLLRVLESNDADFKSGQPFLECERAIQAHQHWLELYQSGNDPSGDPAEHGIKILKQYTKAMLAMREKIASSLSNYDLHGMGFGIMILWIVFIALVVLLVRINAPTTKGVTILLTSAGTLALILTSGLILFIHLGLCTSLAASPLLCSGHLVPICVVVAVSLLVGAVINVLFVSGSGELFPSLKVGDFTLLTGALFVGSLVHTFSLLSSSFVEEEHQTWYFLNVTFHVLSLLLLVKKLIGRLLSKNEASSLRLMDDGYQEDVRNQTPSVKNRLDMMDMQMNDKAARNERNISQKRIGKPKKHLEQNVAASYVSPHSVEEREPGGSFDSCRAGYQHLGVVHTDKQLSSAILHNTVVLLICRLAREWNRTGDKWAHLPDIGDWLVCPEQKVALSALCLFALMSTYVIITCKTKSRSTRALFLVGSCFVYCFRAANGALCLPLVYDKDITKGVTEARIVYSVILLLTLAAIATTIRHRGNGSACEVTCSEELSSLHGNTRSAQRKDPKTGTESDTTQNLAESNTLCRAIVVWNYIQIAWILLMLLLVRPHNIPLVAMVVLQELCVSRCLDHWGQRSVPVWAQTLVFFWMGQASFYYQGNSNSIATVDVSSGYIGLVDYTPALIGLLMCLSTYAGPIFWFISLQKHLSSSATSQYSSRRKSVMCACVVLSLSRALPLAVYTVLVTAQRYHLFVWSVFSPKLLYEGMHSVVMTIMIVIALGVSMVG